MFQNVEWLSYLIKFHLARRDKRLRGMRRTRQCRAWDGKVQTWSREVEKQSVSIKKYEKCTERDEEKMYLFNQRSDEYLNTPRLWTDIVRTKKPINGND